MFVPLLIVQKVEKKVKKTKELSFYDIELTLFSSIILVVYPQ